MPDRRPKPDRLNVAPAAKNRPPKKPRTPRRPRPRKTRGDQDDSTLLYWIAAGLIVLLFALLAIYMAAPQIKNWFVGSETKPAPEEPAPAAPKPPVTPQLTDEQKRLKKLKELKEKAAEQAKLLAEHPLPKTAPAQTALAPLPPGSPPPLVQPVPMGAVPGAPARALPVDMNKLDTERIAAYQVALERIHFSCGFIDGDQGMRTQRMLRAYQASHNLPVTGFLDQPTRDAIGEPGEPFLTYTVTAEDVGSIMTKPPSWIAKSKAKRLGYNDIWELLAEKFHCTRGYLKGLNPTVMTPVAGTEVIGPKVYPAAHIPQAASLRIILSETSIEALDADGKIIAFFPCSIAKDKNKRPHGLLTVKVVDPNPDYTFDPALFADAAKAEGITHKMTIPPGPRNPVGTTWVGLSLPGYGIHGTPEPENISRTQSHGCFRLANWNAEKVLKMVKVGTPVDVEP
jgi:lipoprotein-anchoring transpeptidase ErfK/SrfK